MKYEHYVTRHTCPHTGDQIISMWGEVPLWSDDRQEFYVFAC